MKGLYAWVGFRHIGVPFDPEPRHDGRSAWGFGALTRFATDGLVSFSTKPLTACAWLGAMIAVPSVLMGLFYCFRTLFLGVDIPGYASIVVAVMVLGGVQLLTMGVFGAYLGRLYEEAKRRPMYILRQTEGVDPLGEAVARPVLPLRAAPSRLRAAEPDGARKPATTNAAE
jgi:hypothetical protein